MANGFYKLSSDFTFDFNIEDIISKFVGDLDDPLESNKTHPKIYNSPTGLLHWQHYSTSNIRFARNVYKNLKQECNAIASNLRRLQNSIKNSDNELTDQFLKHVIKGDRLGIIKQQGGHSVNPHIDSNRSLTLNIGLKNSNASRTWVGDQSHLESYIMQDGDVYLLNTSLSHSVESLVTDRDRYIITYTVI
jgi:hypothetical protein